MFRGLNFRVRCDFKLKFWIGDDRHTEFDDRANMFPRCLYRFDRRMIYCSPVKMFTFQLASENMECIVGFVCDCAVASAVGLFFAVYGILRAVTFFAFLVVPLERRESMLLFWNRIYEKVVRHYL